MSKESRWAKVEAKGFDQDQKDKLVEMESRLLNEPAYRVKFLQNPKSFVETEADIEVDAKLMVTVWRSVALLTDQYGQPLEGQVQGISLD